MGISKLNTDNLPKELKFLINIVGDLEFDVDSGELDKEFNWALFLELVFHHRLFPGLGEKLKCLDEGIIPSFVFDNISSWNQTNTFLMLNLTAEMERINQLLLEANIKTLFLKGPILGKVLYGGWTFRTSSDLDILVAIEDLDSVEEFLGTMGYIKDEYNETILNDWKWRHHHFAFYNLERKIKLEVHWRMNPGPGKEPAFTELWARRQSMRVSQSPICFLGYEDLFFFLVTHGSRHGWSRLRWLIDIKLLLKKPLDYQLILNLFEKYNYLPVAGQALLLVSKLLSTSIKEQELFLKKGRNKSWRLASDSLFYMEQMVNLHSDLLPKEVSRYHKKHLISLMSHQQKSLFYLSFFYPYPEDAEVLPLPKKFHFVYFILRPFLWAWRKRKKLFTQGVRG